MRVTTGLDITVVAAEILRDELISSRLFTGFTAVSSDATNYSYAGLWNATANAGSIIITNIEASTDNTAGKFAVRHNHNLATTAGLSGNAYLAAAAPAAVLGYSISTLQLGTQLSRHYLYTGASRPLLRNSYILVPPGRGFYLRGGTGAFEERCTWSWNEINM